MESESPREVREVPEEVANTITSALVPSLKLSGGEYESKYNEAPATLTRKHDRNRTTRSDKSHNSSRTAPAFRNKTTCLAPEEKYEEQEAEEEEEEEEEIVLANILSPLSQEESMELNKTIHQCMSRSGGGAAMSAVLSQWLEEGAENMVSSFMLEIVDDGTTPSRSYTLMPRRNAKRALAVIGATMTGLISTLGSSVSSSALRSAADVGLCRLIRWIYAAMNSNHWTADEIIHGNVDWSSICVSVQQLSVAGSFFTRKTHAAKIYALLRSVVLLESHLEVFAADREEDSSDESSDDEGSQYNY